MYYYAIYFLKNIYAILHNIRLKEIMKKVDSSISKKWLHISDAARFIGVSQDTLRRWERKGKLIPRRTVGGHRRYSRKQLERILNQPLPQSINNNTNTSKGIITKQYTSTPISTFQQTVPQTIQTEENAFLRTIGKFLKNNLLTLGIVILITILLLASFILLMQSRSEPQPLLTPVPAYKEII
jgi:hypothetical protein